MHSHPCGHCRTATECDGELFYNHDGWPETVCRHYHMDCGLFLCEACEQVFQRGACDSCGEPAVITVEDSDDASGYYGERAFCQSCREARVR